MARRPCASTEITAYHNAKKHKKLQIGHGRCVRLIAGRLRVGKYYANVESF